MIGIIAAMAIEADKIKKLMKNTTVSTCGGIEFTEGKVNGKDICLTVCGIGKVFAAMATEAMIIKYSPEVIINTGVSGSVSDKLSVLDFAISERTVQHDMDTSPLGDPKGLISGINKVFFEADERAVALLEECATLHGVNYKRATIASGDRFVASKAEREAISGEFKAEAADMESAAIAHVCYVNNIPFAAARCISDNADSEASIDYPTLCKTAADRSSQIVLSFIERW